MRDLNNLVGEDVHDLRLTAHSLGRGKITALKVGVSVKVIARPGNAQQPVDGFETLVCLGLFVVNSEGR